MILGKLKAKSIKQSALRTAGFFVALAIVFAPLTDTFTPQKAEAQLFGFLNGPECGSTPLNPCFEFTIGGEGTVQDTLSAGFNQITSGIQQALQQKEFTLDGIANSLAKQAVSQMTSSVVTWINSGFQGSPAFVTDINGFLLDIADQVAGDFIYGAGLSFLCSPFELEVRAALEIQYQASKGATSQTQCTFSGVLENMQNFGKSLTNWQDWFEITTKPQNNQYGALLIAKHELDIRVRNAQGQEMKLLEFGNGFLSMKKCHNVAGGKKQCSVVTPGEVIKDQLNRHLGSGLASLIEADEINEIVNALFAQLAQQAVTGLNGLLGLSNGGGSTGGGSGGFGNSYLDDMNAGVGGSVGFNYAGENPMANALEIETDMLEIHEDIFDKINDAEVEAEDTCNALTSSLLRQRVDSREEIASGNIIITTLTRLDTEYKKASVADQSDIYFDFLNLESAGYIHDSIDLSNLKMTRDKLVLEIAAFENGLKDECE